MKAKNFLAGLLVGVTIGAAVAISSAPQKGSQLRNNIQANLNTWKLQLNDVKKETSNVKQSIVTLTNEAKNNIPNIINDVKASISSYKKEIDPQTEFLKQEIGSLQKTTDEIERNFKKIKNIRETPKQST